MFDFDTPIERRSIDNAKWTWFDEDVLPMWVADMDFRSPEGVIEALHARVAQGTFGYQIDSPALRETVVERMMARYGWGISADSLMFSPGLAPALTLACRAFGAADHGVLLQPPIYPPFLSAVQVSGHAAHFAPMQQVQVDETIIHYEIDFDVFEAAISPQTRLLLLSNPHNPLGRVFSRAELERIADICLRRDILICTDEIHSDLILDGEHIPIASLSPEVAARTVTMIAPSKTFNLAGLGCGVLICPNPDLLKTLRQAAEGTTALVNALGFTGALAAYQHGQPWLDALLVYLRGNRDFMVEYVREHLPGVRVTCPQGTYLAWMDFSALELGEPPHEFLLREGRVALNNGTPFGPGGEQCARFNFACPRAQLEDALDRMRGALAKRVSA